MPRVDLNVPFHEKDEAKKLGARWDITQKTWYVPDGVNESAFARWLPEKPFWNVWAPSYFIAEAPSTCWKCHRNTRVFAFLIPTGLIFDSREAYQTWQQDPDYIRWGKDDTQAALYFITHLSKQAQAQIKRLASQYHLDHSQTMGLTYWMNHCEYCKEKQSDFELFQKENATFFPIFSQAAPAILLHAVNEPLKASAECRVYAQGFFDHMTRLPSAQPLESPAPLEPRDRYEMTLESLEKGGIPSMPYEPEEEDSCCRDLAPFEMRTSMVSRTSR